MTQSHDDHLAKRWVAFHEAGHFVASFILRPSVVRGAVTIVLDPVGGTLGLIQEEGWETWYDPMSEEATRDAESEVIVCYCGYEAEVFHDPEAAELAREGATRDEERADFIIELFGFDSAECRRRSRNFVKEHWGEIEALSLALLDRGTLAGDVAEEIVVDAAG